MLARADVACLVAGFSLWFSVVGASGGLSADAFFAALTLRSVLAALLISSSHVLYALVWYSPKSFMSLCAALAPRSTAVSVFSALVAVAKVTQQVGLIGWASTHGNVLEMVISMGAVRWVTALLLMGVGQSLNLSIYRAIGKDGVYYGFKLGRPVPWSTAFPFNAGFRHPQYVGGMLSQLGVFALLATPSSLHAGLLALMAWWVLLYALTSLMEASDDNDIKGAD
uniref:phosphatidyl-N-methylethanolamine N-methyltransferase n=1 Tax=Coccolithus braarudii TaxID=221442 RepID=A0A7S0Q3H6_9EUKA